MGACVVGRFRVVATQELKNNSLNPLTSETLVNAQPNDNNFSVKNGVYKVEKVVDGDTVHIQTQSGKEVVRLIGIDTPETVAPGVSPQCFGQQATEKTTSLLNNKMVRIEGDVTKGDRDKYGRLLRYVYISDGWDNNDNDNNEEINVNLYLVAQGYAYENSYGVHHKHESSFKIAEQNAKVNKIGLWADGVCDK